MSADDPRPVFAGVWATADGKTRQAHMTLVNAWKARHPDVDERAGSGSAKPKDQAERHAADLQVLDSLIATAPLPSDRIRAIDSKQRILARVEQEQREQEHGPLVALRQALDTLAPHERVDALGELLGVSSVPAGSTLVESSSA